jgi:lysophospholipase L1-like esterase
MISNKHKHSKMKKLVFLLGLATLSACKPNIHTDDPFANGLDFSNYVAVGNSLTAGYADNSLYRSGQLNSYPAILASQFNIFKPIIFTQPLLPSESGYPSPKLVLANTTDCAGNTSLSPVPYSGAVDSAGSAVNISAQGPFNNFGIPGIRAVDYLVPGYALFNPYAARIFSNPMVRPLDELKNQNPTFFTLWLGSNDVLGYATSGGEGNPLNSFSPDNISDANLFKAGYDSVLKVLTRGGAKGAIMNIPNVTSIPFFTTIPANGLVLDSNQALQLNMAYAGTSIVFKAGANNFIIQDILAPGGFRQIKDGELILLTTPQDSLKCAGWGSLKPIPQRFVLSKDEIDKINAATTDFNNFIHDEAITYHLPLVDMNAYLRTLATGIKFNGVDFNTQFVSGGAFSLDGVHLTPRGYALAANEILREINAYYMATIPPVDVNKYSGIHFPK